MEVVRYFPPGTMRHFPQELSPVVQKNGCSEITPINKEFSRAATCMGTEPVMYSPSPEKLFICITDGSSIDRRQMNGIMLTTAATSGGGGTTNVLKKGPSAVLPRKYEEGIRIWYANTSLNREYGELVFVPYEDSTEYMCAHPDGYNNISVVVHYTRTNDFDIKVYKEIEC